MGREYGSLGPFYIVVVFIVVSVLVLPLVRQLTNAETKVETVGDYATAVYAAICSGDVSEKSIGGCKTK